MKLYFGNTTTTITTLMILCSDLSVIRFFREQIFFTGEGGLYLYSYLDWLSAVFRQPETGWIRQFNTQSMEAVHREFFHF